MFDALASLRREHLRLLPAHMLLAFAGGGAQELQLCSISATPFAQEKVQPKPELLEK
jgi:hypothetical protein